MGNSNPRRILVSSRIYTLHPESRYVAWKVLDRETFFSAAEIVRERGVRLDGKDSIPQTLDRLAPIDPVDEEDYSSEARLSRALDRFTEGIKVDDGRNEYEEHEFAGCLVMLKDNSRIRTIGGNYHDTWCMQIHPSSGEALRAALSSLCLYNFE